MILSMMEIVSKIIQVKLRKSSVTINQGMQIETFGKLMVNLTNKISFLIDIETKISMILKWNLIIVRLCVKNLSVRNLG